MNNSGGQSKRGFSMLDLVMIIAATAGIILVVLPTVFRTRCCTSSPQIHCVNNLKQVGTAFRLWGLDHNDKLPMQVSVTNGGAMEFIWSGDVAAVFQIMSNELNTPKILFCPADMKRTQAVTFDKTSPSSSSTPFLDNSRVSYFVGVDATDVAPSTFLSGDDNFLVGGNRNNPLSGSPAQPGILLLKTNDFIAWSQARHKKAGNIGLADGSVQQLTTAGLQKALTYTGLATNRFAIP